MFRPGRVRWFAAIERTALRKLKQLYLAQRLENLRAPPANRLEKLTGDRAEQWGIRINDQFDPASAGQTAQPTIWKLLITIS